MVAERTFGLPLRARSAALVSAALVLAYDLATLSRDLGVYDSAELALVAVQLGLSHPIGQPVHTLLGALFAHLPGVPPLVGLALFSAVAHALSAIPVLSLAEALDDTPTPSRLRDAARAALVAGLLLAWPIWEAATRVEVYSLAGLLSSWALARAVPMLRATRATPRDALVVGVALGLLGATNAYHAVLTALALAPALLGALRARTLDLRALSALVGGGLLGLLPYLYVPLVAGRTDVVVWGAPTTRDALLAYFRGSDYARNRGIQFAEFLSNWGIWLHWAFHARVLPPLLVGMAGFLTLGARRSLGRVSSTLLTLGTIALVCTNTAFHPDVTDYVNYLIPALLVAAAGSAALLLHLATRTARGPVLATLLACALLTSALSASPHLLARTRAADHAARVLAEGALAEAPRGAILVVGPDHWGAPLLYLQEVERQRPDVVLVLHGLASSSWYWDHLARRHPDLPDFPLRGPGGRDGRIRRLLDAAPERAVHVSGPELAAGLGFSECDVGFLARVRPCAPRTSLPALDAAAANRALAAAMRAVDTGSPASDGALAAVALTRGASLWRLGRPGTALHALLAGVPPSQRPATPTLDVATLQRAAPLRGPLPEWREPAALGDPRRALFLAALLTHAAGADDAAHAYAARASVLGLPEAGADTAR